MNFVNCTQRNLNTFENMQWPEKPIVEISFKKNKFVRIKPFPSVVIEKLILRQNHITTIDNCAFKKIINLTELDLSDNMLTTENLKPQVFEVIYLVIFFLLLLIFEFIYPIIFSFFFFLYFTSKLCCYFLGQIFAGSLRTIIETNVFKSRRQCASRFRPRSLRAYTFA